MRQLVIVLFLFYLAACRSPPGTLYDYCFDEEDRMTCNRWRLHCKSSEHVQTVCKRTCGLCDDDNSNVEPVGPLPPHMPPNPFLGSNCGPLIGINCPPGQIKHYPKGSCAPMCVSMPKHGCRPIYEHIALDRFTYNRQQCSTITPIVKSKCIGVCASTSVYSLSRRQEREMCFCCKSNRMMDVTALFKCQGSYQPVEHRYSVITSCGCSKCESMMKMAAFGGPSQTISMDEEDFSKDISGAVESFNA